MLRAHAHPDHRYKNAANRAPATPRPIIGLTTTAAPGVATADVAGEPVVRVAVPVARVEAELALAFDPVADAVLVPVGTPVVTVLLPAMALLRLPMALLRLPMMPLAWDATDASDDGTGIATKVVGLGAGGRDVLRPTGMPDGPVGTKLAGVVTASG